MPPSDPSPAPDLPRQSLDLALRSLWRHRPLEVATLALGPGVRAAQVVPSDVIAAVRAPDGVATVLTDAGACTLVLEFETSVKPAELPRRMAHAGWALHGPGASGPGGGLPVRSVVVLVDPNPRLPRSYAMEHAGEVLGTYHYAVVALSEIDVNALLDAPDPQGGLLALVPLARGSRLRHVEEAARRLRALGSPDAPDLGIISLMLGSRRFEYADLVRIFREDFLMGGDAWAYIEQRGYDKGVTRGREEGRDAGREEGRHLAARVALRTVATARFGSALDDVISDVRDNDLEAALAALATAPDAAAARERLVALHA